jgi:hypothetical protein
MSPADRMKEIDRVLDEYEVKAGLPRLLPESAFSDIEKYLNMSRDELEKLSAQDCASIAYRLSTFSFHISRCWNIENTRVHWADNIIKSVIADEVGNYNGYGYVEKAAKAIKHNEYASKLNDIRIYAQQRANRLYDLSNHITNIAKSINNIQWRKKDGDEKTNTSTN